MTKGTNEMHTIYYNVKHTTAKTTYLTIDKSDMDIIQSSILGLLTYLTEMSITVFSEKKSFELYLFSDDIRKFGLVKAMNERQKELENPKE